MKQTNNAIKFLMAQYRAIFKNANIAMVAAALAAGQAQAAANDNALDLGTDAKNPVASDSINSDIKVSGSSGGFIDELTIAKGGTLTFDGSTSANTGHILVGKNLNIQSGGRLILKGSADGQTAGWGVVGTYKGTGKNPVNQDPNFDEANSTLNVDGGTVEITKSQIQMTNVNLNNAAVTIQKNHGDNSNSDWADNAQINAMTDAAGQGGIFNVSGDKTVITMNSGSVLNAHIFNLNDGKIDLKGTSGDGTYAIVRSFGGGSVNLAGSDVTASGTGNLIVGANINISEGSTVTVNASSALTLAGPLNNKSGAATAAAGNIKVTGGLVDVKATGTLNIKGDATFADGTLANAGTVSYTLAQDATNSLTVGSKAFGELLKGKLSVSGVSSSGTETFKLVVDGDADLVTSGFLTADGAINTTHAEFTDVDASSLTAKNVTIGAGTYGATKTLTVDTLTAGKDGAFAIKSGSTVDVAKGLTVTAKDAKADLSVGGTLNLDGTGGNVAANVELAQDNSSTPALNVKSGNWSMQSLKLTSGTATVSGENTKVTFAQTSTLETTTNGKLKIQDNALVDASAGIIKFGAADTVLLTGGSTLVLDGNDVFKIENGNVSLVTAAGDVKSTFTKSAVNTDSTSVLQMKYTGDLSLKNIDDIKGAIADTNKLNGFIKFEGANITDKPTQDTGIADVKDGVDGIYNDVAVTVGKGGAVNKNFTAGQIKLTDTDTTAAVDAGKTVMLTGSKGDFVVKKDGSEADVSLASGAGLVLAGNGDVGAITASAQTAGQKATIAIGHSSLGYGTVNAKSIDGATAGLDVAVYGSTLNVAGKVAASDLTIEDGSALNIKAAAGQGAISATTLTVGQDSSITAAGQAIAVGGSSNGATEILGDVTAKLLTYAGTGSHIIAGDAVVNLDTLDFGSSTVQIGDDAAEANGSATVVVKNLTGTGTLFVDPAYGQKAALVIADSLGAASTPDDKDAGTLSGSAIVGNNAALGIGFSSESELNAVLGQFLDANGSFTETPDTAKLEIANALVLNKQIDIASGKGIVVQKGATKTTQVTGNSVTLDAGTGLIVTDNLYSVQPDGSKTGAAITFKENGTVNGNGGKVILSGNFDGKDDALAIFAADATKTLTVSGSLSVQSVNGLLSGTIAAGSSGNVDLNVNEDALKGAFTGVSAPVAELLKNTIRGEYKGAKGLGADFVYTVAGTSLTGAEVDAASHAATYAGAQQAAVAAVTTMADAMFGRVGAVGVEAASISATGSQANGGVWLTPMYKSVDSDGFNAEGVSYGSDVDLAGVAFGTDTVNGNMRFGAVFNIGSGDAEGKGQGNGLKDEFDYYGFGIYSAMGFGNFALVGDASMTVISHDVEGFGLKGKADTTAVTMGVTGQYTVSTPMVDVTPHLGARFIRLNTDSYDLTSADGVLATTDFDVQNVFSVPVGVTLSKAFVAGGWSLAPSADLTIAFNTGDTDAKSNTQFNSSKPMAVATNTEVLDEVTYGLTLGLGAQYGAFGTSFGINYTGSSNTDSLGVNAQARYMF